MLVFGRLYVDHEMAVLNGSGISRIQVARLLIPLTVIYLCVQSVLMIWMSPWGIRQYEQRILEIKDLFGAHLKALNSSMSIRDYLSYIWTVTYGASLLLNYTHYQKSIGSRERLIKLYVNQALMTPDKLTDSEHQTN